MKTIELSADKTIQGIFNRDLIYIAMMVALFAAMPATNLYLYFIMQAFCLAIFACAFNLLIGYVGLLSFGHAMFIGTGGYIAAHALTAWGLSPELGFLTGVGAAFLLSVAAGIVAIRRQGIYFAMITMGLSQMLYFVYLQAPFTHGEDGIHGIPKGMLFGLIDLSDILSLYYVVLAVFVFVFLLIRRIVNSPFGEVLQAIRENEQRAISLGYEADHYKLLAFILSGTLAGVAGALKVFVTQNASLTDVHWHMSGEVVLMSLIGGLGTLFGPVIGAFIVSGMQQYLAGFGEWVTVIHGLVFIACVLLFRRGIVGMLVRPGRL